MNAVISASSFPASLAEAVSAAKANRGRTAEHGGRGEKFAAAQHEVSPRMLWNTLESSCFDKLSMRK